MPSSDRRSGSAAKCVRVRGLPAPHVEIVMVAIVLIVVACGGPTPTAPSGSPATAAVSSLPLNTASPGASAITGLAAPTAEPSHSLRIPIVPCPTSFGLPDETMPPVPTTMTATVTPEVAALVTYYGNGTLTLLGPKDWRCEAAVGADGSAGMTITPPRQPVPSGSPPPDEQAITASTGGACVGCVATMACGLFPEAWNLFAQPGLACPTAPPVDERVTRPRPRSAVFEDPPGVAGTGDPSGGRYRAFGFLVFDPARPAGDNGQTAPSALKVTCTLPDAMAQICDEIVEGIGRGQPSSGG